MAVSSHHRVTTAVLRRVAAGHAQPRPGLQLPSASEMHRVFDAVDSVIQHSYCVVAERLRADYELVDPAAANMTPSLSPTCEEDVLLAQHRFIRVFTALVQRAHFQPVNRQEAEFALATQLRVSLPVTVDWSQLQSGLMTHGGAAAYGLTTHGSAAYATPPPGFANKLLVFKRGRGVEVQTGYFLSDKVDELFSRALRNAKTGFLRLLTAAGTRVRRLLLPRSEAIPSAPAVSGSSASDLALAGDGDTDDCGLRQARVGLGDLPLNPTQLLSTVELRDPTFSSVVLLYSEATVPSRYALAQMAWAQRTVGVLERLASVVDGMRRVVLVTGSVLQDWRAHREARAERVRQGVVADNDWYDLTFEDLERLWLGSEFRGDDDTSVQAAQQQQQQQQKQHHHHHQQQQAGATTPAAATAVAAATASDDGIVPPVAVHPIVALHDSITTPPRRPPGEPLPTSVRVGVRELRAVPVSELLLSFPATYLQMKALDIARLVVLGSAGYGIIHQLAQEEVLSRTGLFALGSLALIALRLYWRYQIARTYCEHRAGQVATSRAYSRDFATVATIINDVTEVETQSVMAVYAALCSSELLPDGTADDWLPAVAVGDVRAWCASLEGGEPADVDAYRPGVQVDVALDTLQTLGLVQCHDDGTACALRPAAAQALLRDTWMALLLTNSHTNQ